MVKNGYYENDGSSLAWDLDVIFLGAPNLWLVEAKKWFFFYLDLKGIMEKCVGCFLVYLFYGFKN